MCLISGIKCRARDVSGAETKRLSLRDLRTYVHCPLNLIRAASVLRSARGKAMYVFSDRRRKREIPAGT